MGPTIATTFKKIVLLFLLFATCVLFSCIISNHNSQNYKLLQSSRFKSLSWVTALNMRAEKRFTILFWTGEHGQDAVKMYFKSECEHEFLLTSNRSMLESADVIVFFYVDVSRDHVELPSTRKANVPWGLAFHEASINYGLLDTTIYNGLFNFTWSFRTDSEVHPEFDKMVSKYKVSDDKWRHESKFATKFLQNKTHMAAWMVSNCRIEPSRRNQLVETLESHGVIVDVYGGCGNKSCTKNENCFEKLGQKYKFYMSLENSLCVDYVTEKIFHGLFNNMVPIVYALGDVKNYAPPGSFIDVMEFDTIESLAKYIKFLDNNPKEYFKYFEWRATYNISNVYNSIAFSCHNWRRMRQFAQGETIRQHNRYSDLKTWYYYYYNTNLHRYCKRCLLKGDVSVDSPRLNNLKIYGNFSSMC